MGTLFCSASMLFSIWFQRQKLCQNGQERQWHAAAKLPLLPNVSQQHQHATGLQLNCSPSPQQQAALELTCPVSLVQRSKAQVQPSAAAAEPACPPAAVSSVQLPSLPAAAELTCSLVSLSSMQLPPAHRRPSARLMSKSASKSFIRCSKRCCSQAVDWTRTKLQARGGVIQLSVHRAD